MAEDVDTKYQKLEFQVERFRIQLERIVSDIESEKRTRTEANSEIRQQINRMGEKFDAALKELADSYKTAIRDLSQEFKASHRELSQHNDDAEEKTRDHLREQDKFQYKIVGALIAIQVTLAFLAPWLYKTVFKVAVAE